MTRRFNASDNLIEFSDIEIFEMVRSGAMHTFTKDFWNGINALDTAKEITRYLFEKILKWDIEDIKHNSLSDIFYNNRLGSMLKNLFNNSVYKAIVNAYPELEEWAKDLIQQDINYTDEELIENIQQKANELGNNPYLRQMTDPDGSAYITRFGSWEKALIAAELLEDIYKDLNLSKESEIQKTILLKDIVINNDRLPTEEEVFTIFSQGELKTYFRSMINLYSILETEYSKEELIKILKKKKEKLQRIPTGRDMKTPRAILYIDAFGSWDNALREAGLTD